MTKPFLDPREVLLLAVEGARRDARRVVVHPDVDPRGDGDALRRGDLAVADLLDERPEMVERVVAVVGLDGEGEPAGAPPDPGPVVVDEPPRLVPPASTGSPHFLTPTGKKTGLSSPRTLAGHEGIEPPTYGFGVVDRRISFVIERLYFPLFMRVLEWCNL